MTLRAYDHDTGTYLEYELWEGWTGRESLPQPHLSAGDVARAWRLKDHPYQSGLKPGDLITQKESETIKAPLDASAWNQQRKPQGIGKGTICGCGGTVPPSLAARRYTRCQVCRRTKPATGRQVPA